MNSKEFFRTVNQICDEYKIEHGIVEKQATITVQVPKFKAGQPVLWSGKDEQDKRVTAVFSKLPLITKVTGIRENQYFPYKVDCNGWVVAESELRGVGDTVYCKDLDAIITITDISKDYIYYVLNGAKGRTTPKSLSFTPPEPKPVERPTPKFAVGDKTNKGEIAEEPYMNKMPHESEIHWHYIINDMVYDESELTKLPEPEITVTLFKVKDGKVETCNNYTLQYDMDKNEFADGCFRLGYCAILIDDGKTKQRRYHPVIEALPIALYEGLCGAEKGWKTEGYAEESQILKVIQWAINHPRWTVESNGVKMKAYKLKSGAIRLYFDDKEVHLMPMSLEDEELLLKALGLNGHEMPQILSGKR